MVPHSGVILPNQYYTLITLVTVSFFWVSVESTEKLQIGGFSVVVELENDTIEIPFTDFIWNNLSFQEQNQLVKSILMKELDFATNEFLSTHYLTNRVVYYLTHINSSVEKINEISAAILKPLNEYGSEKEEEITLSQKITVIHSWLKQSILGMTFLDWILNEMQIIKMEGNDTLLTLGYFEYLIVNQLHDKVESGKLSAQVEKYYLENLLKEDMPNFLLETNDDTELERVRLMNLDDPEFGYLYVGLKLLKYIQHDLNETWKIDDVENIGILIESLIHEGKTELVELFEIPAEIYYASTFNENMTPSGIIWTGYYEKYFIHLRNSNPLYQMVVQLDNWKNRTTLAKQILKQNDVSEEIFLQAYLNHGDSSEGFYPNSLNELVQLPSVDDIFDEHTKNATISYRDLDKLILSHLFNKVHEEDKNFIQTAEINLVRAKIIDRLTPNLIEDLRNKSVPSYINAMHNPIFLEADNIDLLQCVIDNQQRIYALDTRNYELHRIDFDKDKYLQLLNHTDLSSIIHEYILSLTPSKFIKERKETSFERMINELSEIHRIKLYHYLKAVGYEATFWQKLTEFSLNLIPFYTCIKELKNENFADAKLPCALDIVSLIPAVGQGIRIGYRFGSTAIEVSIHSLQLAARQASIKQILRHAAQNFFKDGILQVQKTINSKAFYNLGHKFLRGIDPGISLLKLGGMHGVIAIKKATTYLKYKFFKLEEFAEKLLKRAEEDLSSASLIPGEILNSQKQATLPYTNREVMVVKIGSKNEKDVVVQCLENKILFGKKYLMDRETSKLEMVPITFRERIHKIMENGLNGDAIGAGRFLADWESHQVALTTTEHAHNVFYVDRRDPVHVLGALEKFRPRNGPYNYNLELLHTLTGYSGIPSPISTPFLTTTASLSAAIKRSKFLNYMHDLQKFGVVEDNPHKIIGYIYNVRPDSNFYNIRQSYIAARDVCKPDSERYKLLDDMINKMHDVYEYGALNGFSRKRVINWASVRMSDDDTALLEWTPNPWYSNKFDNDQSSKDIYTSVYIYKPEDSLDMGTNIVQNYRGVKKSEAGMLLTCNLDLTQIEELVRKYNTRKSDLRKIMDLRRNVGKVSIVKDYVCAK